MESVFRTYKKSIFNTVHLLKQLLSYAKIKRNKDFKFRTFLVVFKWQYGKRGNERVNCEGQSHKTNVHKPRSFWFAEKGQPKRNRTSGFLDTLHWHRFLKKCKEDLVDGSSVGQTGTGIWPSRLVHRVLFWLPGRISQQRRQEGHSHR